MKKEKMWPSFSISLMLFSSLYLARTSLIFPMIDMSTDLTLSCRRLAVRKKSRKWETRLFSSVAWGLDYFQCGGMKRDCFCENGSFRFLSFKIPGWENEPGKSRVGETNAREAEVDTQRVQKMCILAGLCRSSFHFGKLWWNRPTTFTVASQAKME